MIDWRFYRVAFWLTLLGLTWLGPSAGIIYGSDQEIPATSSSTEASSSDELALTQSRLADKYQNLEKLLLRMAEYDAGMNPHRAELLLRVFAECKDRQVQLQFETLVQLLREEQLGQALGSQKQLRTDLDAMLKLLMSENRADRIKSEKARVREYIRELERLERMQRSVQGRTEGGIAETEASKEQQDLADRTQALDQEIEKNEKPADSSAGDNPSDSKQPSDQGSPSPSSPGESSEAESSDGKPSDGKPSGGKSSEPSETSKAPQSKDGTPSENGSPNSSEAPSSESNQDQPPSSGSSPGDESEKGEDRPPDQSFPGQQNLQKARQAMERAVEKLKKAEREGAVRDQHEAAQELAEAKARLEEILRQLREEEIERALALLETRVKLMLDMEIRIHDETVRLDQQAVGRPDRSWEIDAGKLSFEQRRVILEADKALALLREEGSSAAFPETLSQARADMDQVAARLAQAKTGDVTQSIEEDIVAALEEMLEALKQAQNEQRQRQQNTAPLAQDPGDLPLVDQIAELRMIKSLQLRINRRTNRYAQLLGDENDIVGQATDNELVTALQELSDREARLHELTRDIVLGKNR